MMPYDPEHHHRRSVRLPSHDYVAGWYAVTICTHDRMPLFGAIIDAEMRRSHFGAIVEAEWLCTPFLRDDVCLDAYVIMPNHLHGILTIEEQLSEPLQPVASSERALQRRPRSLGMIMAGFKSATTKRINVMRETPGAPVWQHSFYDSYVTSDRRLGRLRDYIAANPAMWHDDPENPYIP